jgi:UDP-glucose 4-epimerase
MKVVVTGATGNLGSSLMSALKDDGAVSSVVAVARRSPGSLPNGVAWHRADIVEEDLGSAFEGADVVVHLAWAIQPSRDVGRLWDVNVRGTAAVLQAAAAAGVGSVVHASSVGTYSPGPSNGARVDESWPTHGIGSSSYSRAKAYTERLLDTFEARFPSVRVVRLRPALIFKGAAATRVRRLFLGPLFPRSALHPGRLPVLPRVPGLRFQAVHTDDVAEAFRLAVVGRFAGAANLAAEPVLSLEDIAELLGARTVPVPAAVARPAVAATWAARLHPVDVGWFDMAWQTPLLDTARAREELGWTPRHTSLSAVAEMIRGIRDGAGGPTRRLPADDPILRVGELAARQGASDTAP